MESEESLCFQRSGIELESDLNLVRMESVPLLSIQISYWAEAPHLSLLWESVLHLTLS